MKQTIKPDLQGEITCKKCGYKWQTRSILAYINCPNCRSRNKNTYGSFWKN